MADVIAAEAVHGRFTASAPYGNLSRVDFPMETNAAGALIGSNQKTALLNGDIVYLRRLPKGTKIGMGTDIVISDAFTATTTLKVGFEYADGVDDADFPENDAFFHAAGSTAALGRLNTVPNVEPKVLPKDAWIIATVGGADHASAGKLNIMLDMEFQGIRGVE